MTGVIEKMILEKNGSFKNALKGKVVLLTGGGGGIGTEAARAFAYMGANVIIAEINEEKGRRAEALVNKENDNHLAEFFPVDLSDEKKIDEMLRQVIKKYSTIDVLINNAAVVPMGAIDSVPIADWDLSYAVNLRAPVLLTQKVLPLMQQTGGVIVFIPSATPTPYMSAYEIFKTAQTELCETLRQEVDGKRIYAFSIAPGFVKTDTAVRSVDTIAKFLKIKPEDFFKSLEEHITDAETAGAGYAVSVVFAEQYNGKEVMSVQVLEEHGLLSCVAKASSEKPRGNLDLLTALFSEISDIFFDQYNGWLEKKMFQRQFILSDFKKQMCIPADSFKVKLEVMRDQLSQGEYCVLSDNIPMFLRWQNLYRHQMQMLRNYEKNKAQLERDLALLDGWITTLQKIIDELSR